MWQLADIMLAALELPSMWLAGVEVDMPPVQGHAPGAAARAAYKQAPA